MAKLNSKDSGPVVNMMSKPGWAELLKLVTMTIRELNDREIPGQNEFETLRALHTVQGKVEGVMEFFNNLENGSALSNTNQ